MREICFHHHVKCNYSQLKGKGQYSSSSELRDVTRHMGSHGVTCHLTQVNEPCLTPAMQVGTGFTYPRGMEG